MDPQKENISLAEASNAATDKAVIRPTKKQQLLLEFIGEFIGEHGYSPSYREIMSGAGYNSVATVALHVNNLVKRGHIKKRNNSARSLEVITPNLTEPSKIKTNLVRPSEEKWLIEKVDYIFSQAEAEAIAPSSVVNDLKSLIDALELLGLSAGATQFRQRLLKLSDRENANN